MSYAATPFRVARKLDIHRVALIPKKDERRPREFADTLGRWLRQRGVEVCEDRRRDPRDHGEFDDGPHHRSLRGYVGSAEASISTSRRLATNSSNEPAYRPSIVNCR